MHQPLLSRPQTPFRSSTSASSRWKIIAVGVACSIVGLLGTTRLHRRGDGAAADLSQALRASEPRMMTRSNGLIGSVPKFRSLTRSEGPERLAIRCGTSLRPNVEKVKAGKGTGKVVVSPSVAKANFLYLGEELSSAVRGGAEWLHFSIQDGRMVPKISFGAPVVAACRDAFPDTVFDVKLGVIEPEHRISDFIKAGADIISVHPEATLQLPAVINKIKDAGCSPGVVINPGTSLSTIEHIIEDIDVVVIMLVNPGWGGPKYMKEAVAKIKGLKMMCAAKGVPTPWIEVDGGVSAKNANELLEAGATALVAGGSVFTADNKAVAIDALKGATQMV